MPQTMRSFWRIAPGRRVFGVERGVGDVHRAAVVGNRGQAVRRASGDAVIERIDDRAGPVEAIDQAGVEIGNEELATGLVVDDVAEARTGVGTDRSEERDRSGRAIDFVDAAGRAGRAPLALHELSVGLTGCHALGPPVAVAVGRDDLQAEGRGGAEIDVRHLRVIKRDRENLTDAARQRGEDGRRRDQLAGGRRRRARAAGSASTRHRD